MTNQPKWLCIANLGDVNPLDYGGLFVMIDTTGVYDPEIIKFDVINGEAANIEEKDLRYRVYRGCIDQCIAIGDTVSDNCYHPTNPAWFNDQLGDVASFIGKARKELLVDLIGCNIVKRAIVYAAIFDYHGWENCDSYAQDYDRKGAEDYIEQMKKAGWTGK